MAGAFSWIAKKMTRTSPKQAERGMSRVHSATLAMDIIIATDQLLAEIDRLRKQVAARGRGCEVTGDRGNAPGAGKPDDSPAATAEPVAWAVWVDRLEPVLCVDPVDAAAVAEESNADRTPLYLHPPKPLLTDEDAELLGWLASAGDEARDTHKVLTPAMRALLRGLLERAT